MRSSGTTSFIEFELEEIHQIEPWGEERALSLSWFSFSLGRYRLKLGEHYLLNYSEQAIEHHAAQQPDAYPGPWVDYQVARLWEDLIELVPYVLTPIAEKLVPLARLGDTEWQRWSQALFDWADISAAADRSVQLLHGWRAFHLLDTSYLDPSARIWFWRIGDDIEVRWDNTNRTVSGVPAWSSQRGDYRMPVAEYIAAIQSFNDRFMAAMGERIEKVWDQWNSGEVRVDNAELRREQSKRSAWLARKLERHIPQDESKLIAAADAALKAVPFEGLSRQSQS